MKNFDQLQQNLLEAKISQKQIDDLVGAAKKALLEMEKALQDAKKDLTSDQIKYFKNRIALMKDRTDPKQARELIKIYGHSTKDVTKSVKIFHQNIKGAISQKDAVEKAKKVKPLTICDLFQQPSPDLLIGLIKGENDASVPVIEYLERVLKVSFDPDTDLDWLYSKPWFKQLEKFSQEFAEWFDQQGGSKRNSVNAIRIAHSCKNRAPWTKFKGKVYRGLGRSIDRIVKYKFTGDMVKMDYKYYLVSTVKYKGKYGVQSWTPSLGVALDFSEGGPIHTIFEAELGDDAFLNPKIINQMSGWQGEDEVLRVSDEAKDVKAYVNIRDIITSLPKFSDEQTVSKWTEKMFGSAAAKKLMKNKAYISQFKLK